MERTGLSRREAMSAGGGTAAVLLLGGVAPTQADSRRRKGVKRADVVVVGAGISGLTAARRLVQAGVKSVVVLEANPRVGGRTVNLDVAPGVITEGGGEWVGPGQDHVLGLIKELGLATFKTYATGRTLYLRDGQRTAYDGTIPPLGPTALADFAQLQTRLEQMASTVPVEAPWTAPDAVEWDSTTFGAWLDRNSLDAEAKWLMSLAFTVIQCQDPRCSTLLETLYRIAASDGIDHMVNTTGGAQEQRVVGGSQLIPLTMAEQLGRRVIRDSPVSEIRQRANDVVVTSKRIKIRCRRVIVAMSPADADRIRFAPELPTRRSMVQSKWASGSENKIFAVYDTPWWREQGLNGQAVTDLPMIPYLADNSPPDGKPGILVAFWATAGSAATLAFSDALLDHPAARKAQFVKDLTTLFGPVAANPIQILEKDWVAEPWINGCVSSRPPGLLTQYTNAARAPVGRVHWAGTETAVHYESYMDGAVSAGERAAREVVDAL